MVAALAQPGGRASEGDVSVRGGAGVSGAAPKKAMASEGADERRAHIELMREMGASEYDPVAPDQYLFRLDPAMKLSSVAHELHAWLLWMSVHSRKPGGRTSFAAWGDRALGLQDASHDLHRDLPAISKAWKELTEKGLSRRDSKDRLCACGRVPFKMPKHGEEKEKKGGGEEKRKLSVQTTLPDYISLRLQQLGEESQKNYLQNKQRLDLAEDEAIAEVTAQVREAFASPRKALLATIGLKPIELEKRRHKQERREPLLKVSLQLELPEFEFVQTSADSDAGLSAQSKNATSYKPENPSAQTTHPYKQSFRDFKEKLAASPEAKNELQRAVRETIARSRLRFMGGKELDDRTVENICSHLEQLAHPQQVMDVIDVLEDKCRFLEKRPGQTDSKTWGWVVAVVKGEVNNRVGEAKADLQEQLRSAAATKGMR